MRTFAENFVAEIHNKPAPISSEDEANPDGTIFEGGIDTIAENCNVKDVDRDNAELLEDDDAPQVLQAGAGIYYFQDGSKAGLRYHFSGKWDAWVIQ